MKDHEIAALVNELRDTAIEYREAQQLREWIATLIVPALRGARSPAPVAEIREPTDDECTQICFAEMKIKPMQSWPAIRGRAMFDAVRAVMFPQKSEVQS